MPKSQTLPKPPVIEKSEELKPSIDASQYFASTSTRTIAETAGRFKDSAFFDEVVENMRIREEEESKKYAEEE